MKFRADMLADMINCVKFTDLDKELVQNFHDRSVELYNITFY